MRQALNAENLTALAIGPGLSHSAWELHWKKLNHRVGDDGEPLEAEDNAEADVTDESNDSAQPTPEEERAVTQANIEADLADLGPIRE